jgi:integration host factor subunit beta
LQVVERKPKIGRNPKNASVPIHIPARRAVKFTPGKKMRRLIEGTKDMDLDADIDEDDDE